jgi:hypothetical protein
MTVPALLLCLQSISVSFPLEPGGEVNLRYFFQHSLEHFMRGEVSGSMKTIDVDGLEWTFGLSTETFMGRQWSHPEMVFHVWKAHWTILSQWAYRVDPVLLRLYSEHECYHNIDMADTLGHYLNNVKIGAVYDPPLPLGSPTLEWFPEGGVPRGWISAVSYIPRGTGLQKGHIYDWGIESEATVLLAARKSSCAGVTARSELIVNQDGTTLGRVEGELFWGHHTDTGGLDLFASYHFLDNRPIDPLEGQGWLGFRVYWGAPY